jgi:hypothetical protein
MDNPLSRAGSSLPRSRSFESGFQVFGWILSWLTSLFLLSDEQQEQAGVYLGARRRR